MKIFVTGKFGTGKSTFLNGLFGGRIEAEIGVGLPHIDVYTFEMASGSLTVYDSPGQEFNATSFLHWMREECNDVDISDSGRLSFFEEMARSQERLELRATNAYQTTSQWLLFAKNRESSQTNQL